MRHVRPYAITDREACLRLFDSNVPEYFDRIERPGFERFLDPLPSADVPFFVVEDQGLVVACGGVAVEDGDARLCYGIVERGRHRQGIGRVLLAVRLLAGAERGARSASLETVPEVAGFFDRLGFEACGGEDDHYAPGRHRRDFVLALGAFEVARFRGLTDEERAFGTTFADGMPGIS